ncbi:DegV family protein [Vagococcus xieshaowenii]|uniref:DegV family protein n=1 Tax=Vagococcus xieshaowenii TaxID=2562451 RepID=A0AAJ5EGS0_9ENTE|nr:DegV family protein [Vagococcus xieshaowenii]QCA28472.1 DegV family protein [Vagococcus xieshaowenii]TFZ42773.1 DegV family protein [Vagococcus xieshaowenii]
MKTAIVTDSTAFLPETVKNHPDVYVIPIPIIIDGKIYNEGVDVADESQFYQLLRESKELPSTSQPSIGEVLELYSHLAKEGYERVISIHLSSGISGFINNLIGMSPGIEEIEVIPFDSKITSMPMGHMVSVALEMSQNQEELDTIVSRLEFVREHTEAYLIVDDLNHLVRGGRLKNSSAIIGSLLKIKPVLKFDQGSIVLSEKIRSSKKAFARAEDLIVKHYKKAKQEHIYYLIHANSLQIAEIEKIKLEEKCPGIHIEIGHLGPVVGTHVGEKTIGFAWSAK